jgi:hypothetical protein
MKKPVVRAVAPWTPRTILCVAAGKEGLELRQTGVLQARNDDVG